MVSGTCMRCPYGRPRDAEFVRQFTIGDDSEEVYVIRLCAEHARRFDCDFNIWANLADVVEANPPTIQGVRPKVSREIGDDAAARIRELRERAARRSGATAKVAQDDEGDVLLGARADEWRFSVHAQDQAKLRHFTPEQVLKAAAYPDTTMPNSSPEHPSTFFHVLDPCCAVVDRKTKRIVTVYTKFEYLCKSVNNARKVGVV